MKRTRAGIVKTLRSFLPARLRRFRISRKALARRTIPALLTAALVAVLVFIPAYRFETPDHRLTRFELAQMFESVLESCRVSAQPDNLPEYSDLNDDQLFSVYRTLSCHIIRGYPDFQFKPDEYLRNIETISYLQRLMLFLREVKPDSDAGRQIVRLMAYQDSPAEVLAGNLSSFMPEELSEPAGFSDREVVAELIATVIGQPRPINIDGRVINAFTGRPLARAFVASGKIATVTDDQGFFRISYPLTGLEEVTIMAAAENFQPVELKKNIKFNQNIVFRLKPAKAPTAF